MSAAIFRAADLTGAATQLDPRRHPNRETGEA